MSEETVNNPVAAAADILVEAMDNKPVEIPEEDEAEDVITSGSEDENTDDETLDSDEDSVNEEDLEEDSEDDDEGNIDTLNNLAEQLETPVEDLYQLNVKMQEGESQTIGKLKDFYEANQDIETLRTGIVEQEQALDLQLENVKQVPVITEEILQARANTLSIVSQYNKVDWNGLRQQNPGQYAALQQDFNTQYAQATQAEKSANVKIEEHTKQQEKFERDKLLRLVPELKDPAVGTQASSDITNYASRFGYSASEVANITDSRLMHLLYTAAKSNLAVDTAKNKQVAKKLPKSNKPAGVKKTLSNRKQTLKNLTAKAKKSGSRTDIGNAVSALLG